MRTRTRPSLRCWAGRRAALRNSSTRRSRCPPCRCAGRVNTQLILAEETGVTHVVDPLGGSYYVEALTQSIANEAWSLIQEVEQLGGMTKAVESGMPKLRIEEASARRQARVDRGDETIVGVNKYRLDNEAPIDTRSIDNTEVRRQQLVRLERVKARRDPKRVQDARRAHRGSKGHGNLLALSIEATERARPSARSPTRSRRSSAATGPASVRSPACTAAPTPTTRSSSASARRWRRSRAEEGRRPRILVAKLGQDGHDRGAKVVATAFADLGFDVDIGPLFQTPEEAAREAIENDVHVVGISSQAAGHDARAPAHRGAAREGADEIVVVVGGVIPASDYAFLHDAGVAAVFGPGSNIPHARVGDPRVDPTQRGRVTSVSVSRQRVDALAELPEGVEGVLIGVVALDLGDPAALHPDELATGDVEAPALVIGRRVLDRRRCDRIRPRRRAAPACNVPPESGPVRARKSSWIACQPRWSPARAPRPGEVPHRCRG